MSPDFPDARISCRAPEIALDNVLIDHNGKFIPDARWFWHHAEQRNKIAHHYLFANYVCPGGKSKPGHDSPSSSCFDSDCECSQPVRFATC